MGRSSRSAKHKISIRRKIAKNLSVEHFLKGVWRIGVDWSMRRTKMLRFANYAESKKKTRTITSIEIFSQQCTFRIFKVKIKIKDFFLFTSTTFFTVYFASNSTPQCSLAVVRVTRVGFEHGLSLQPDGNVRGNNGACDRR